MVNADVSRFLCATPPEYMRFLGTDGLSMDMDLVIYNLMSGK